VNSAGESFLFERAFSESRLAGYLSEIPSVILDLSGALFFLPLKEALALSIGR